jgi:hypothetical protein
MKTNMKENPKPEMTPFQRFQWLARRLVAVPKTEIEEEKPKEMKVGKRALKKNVLLQGRS